MVVVVVVIPVHHAVHLLHVLKVLLAAHELVDAGDQGLHLIGHIAVVADKAVGVSRKQRIGVLQDAEGLQILRTEHQRTIVGLDAEQPVGAVHHQGAAEQAEAVAVVLAEGLAQGGVFLVKGHVLLQLRQGHAVQGPVGQVDLPGALLAQGHILHLGGQEPGGGIAAKGAGFFVIAEKSHSDFPPISMPRFYHGGRGISSVFLRRRGNFRKFTGIYPALAGLFRFS